LLIRSPVSWAQSRPRLILETLQAKVKRKFMHARAIHARIIKHLREHATFASG